MLFEERVDKTNFPCNFQYPEQWMEENLYWMSSLLRISKAKPSIRRAKSMWKWEVKKQKNLVIEQVPEVDYAMILEMKTGMVFESEIGADCEIVTTVDEVTEVVKVDSDFDPLRSWPYSC